MQRINPTILSTPLGVYHVVKGCIAPSEMSVAVQNQAVVLQIRFSPVWPEMSLTHAVNAEAFQKTVQQVKICLETAAAFKIAPQPFAIDPHHFSLQEPLSNWQEYRRFMWQNSGHSCTDTIVGFLQNPAETHEVSQLGLAPTQIDGRATPDDMAYFREIPEKLRSMNQPLKEATVTTFAHSYPNIFRQIMDELAARDRAARVDEADNFYRDTVAVLKQQVMGQDLAVEKMTALLAAQRNLPTNKVFLFVGPSGVGKTELAKAVARFRNNRFITIPMQTYQDEHGTAKFFGSSPGYVGSTDKPHFAKELDRYEPALKATHGTTKVYQISNVVILFDEFEKAHSQVKQSLLTLFDEGIYVAQYSEEYKNVTCRYELQQCIIANTSNLYQNLVLQAFIDRHPCEKIIEIFKQLNRDLPTPQSLSPELLNRMSIVPFGPIPRGDTYQHIIRIKLNNFCTDLKQELMCRAVDIEQEALVLSALETKLYGDGTDLRRFGRYFDDIKPIIYRNYQNWGPLASKRLTFSCVDGALCIKISAYIEIVSRYHESGIPPLRLP
jgi:hypothetical protein